MVSKFNVGLKSLVHQGLAEPEFHCDLVYKFKQIMGRIDFSDQFRKKNRHKCIGYDLNVMRQHACLAINPITVENFAALFNCTRWIGRQTQSWLKIFILVGFGRSSYVCCLVHRGSTDDFLLIQISSGVVWQTRDLHLSRNKLYLLSPRLCFFIVLKGDLFVYLGDSLTS